MTAAAIDSHGKPSRYTFSNTARDGEQLTLLADILDQHTFDVLTSAGIQKGWRCLDVGAGAGTITGWMADQVGSKGRVTALDLEPQLLPGVASRYNNLTIQQGDVRTIALPTRHYDLVHARLVLLHLAERLAILDRLVAMLRPGGFLVVSDWDATDRDWLLHAPSREAAEAYLAFQDTLLAILSDNGADLGWARRAPLAMRAAGLDDVNTVVHNRLWPGGTAGNMLHVSNSLQMHDALLARGMTQEQLDLFREAMQDPQTLTYCYWTFTTVGRRPE